MCRFASAIVTRKGEILLHDLTDSHSDLIAHFGLNEGKRAVVKDQNFIRLEFTPAADDKGVLQYDKPDGYTLSVDESFTPDWFNADLRETVTKFMRGRIERMIIRDKRAILLGGSWIVADGAEVEVCRDARIVAITGGTVSAIRGGTVSAIRGGTVSAIWGGTVSAIWGGTVSAIGPYADVKDADRNRVTERNKEAASESVKAKR